MKTDYSKLFEIMDKKNYTMKDLRSKAKLSYESIYKIYTGASIPQHEAEQLYKVFGFKAPTKKTIGETRHPKIPINQYDLDGNLIATHSGIRAAGRNIGRSHNAIRSCALRNEMGYDSVSYGYVWKFAKEE